MSKIDIKFNNGNNEFYGDFSPTVTEIIEVLKQFPPNAKVYDPAGFELTGFQSGDNPDNPEVFMTILEI